MPGCSFFPLRRAAPFLAFLLGTLLSGFLGAAFGNFFFSTTTFQVFPTNIS